MAVRHQGAGSARSGALLVALVTVVALLLGVAPAATAAEGTGPVANPDSATTPRGVAIVLDVTANDEPQDGSLQVLDNGLSRPDHGDAEKVSGSQVRYTPDDGYVGPDTFTYEVTDGVHHATGTVTITVTGPVALTVATSARWKVLRPATITGTAPAGAELSVRITGPSTVRTLAVTVPAGTTWSAQFTASWPGEHRVVVTEGGSKDQAALSVTAVATYLSAVSGRLTAADVRYSYRPGCPVAPSQLRRLTITYWDWHGRPRTGQVIARARAVRDLRAVFRVAFRTRFPLRSVTPVDEYYADGRRTSARSDIATMAADNTSAFNCRRVTGNRHRISPHAYGTAIDLNPFENPYVTHRRYYPHGAKKYLNRSKARKGMLLRSSPVVKAFQRRGWRWGVRYARPDYQHFDMR